jgi:hypothetical protein
MVVLLLGILAVVVGFGWLGQGWSKPWLTMWYGMRTGSSTGGDYRAEVIVSNPGASDLEPWGMKVVFLDGARFEKYWKIGMGYQYGVFWYQLSDGRGRWVAVPMRGVAGEALAEGDWVQLAFLYRYSERASAAEAREELIARRVERGGKPREQAAWEVGDFPGKAWLDDDIRGLFGGSKNVVVLDKHDLLLMNVWRVE